MYGRWCAYRYFSSVWITNENGWRLKLSRSYLNIHELLTSILYDSSSYMKEKISIPCNISNTNLIHALKINETQMKTNKKKKKNVKIR